jgi:hypothetical protein
MTDLLEAGQAWLANQLQEHASRSVIYQRGAQSVAVLATIGRTLLKLDDGYGGVRMEWTDRDFLIPATSLVLTGVAATPEPGDRITETVGLNTSVFEVMAFGGEPAWRCSDPFGKLLRIHTKFIGIN